MSNRTQWHLGAMLALVGLPFLALELVSIAVTLWLCWQLEGGAAAINEAGRMRMQAYRMALSVSTDAWAALPAQLAEFDGSLHTLRAGDPQRPLFVSWDDSVRECFDLVRGIEAHMARWTALLHLSQMAMMALAWPHKLHLVLGMTIFLLFSFSRLVHVWSGFAALAYVLRPSQLVRSRQLNLRRQSISSGHFDATRKMDPDSGSGHV